MYTYNNIVSFSQIDSNGLLSYNNIMNAMQDGIMFHNSSINQSAMKLREMNRAWMVSSWHVVFHQRPMLDTPYCVKTWIYERKALFSWNITLTNANSNHVNDTMTDKPYVTAESNWFYADISTGKPARLEKEQRSLYPTGKPLDMKYLPRKIAYPENSELLYTIPISPCFLDTNLHVNNAEYIRLAINALPYNYDIAELRAEYQMSAHYGETFYVRIAEDELQFPNRLFILLTKEDGSPYFISEFQKRV